MAGLIDELMNTLEKENEEYQVLLKLSQEKTGIIIRNDVNALQKLVEQEQLVVDRITPLEKKRVEYTKDIAAVKKRLGEIHDKLHNTMAQMVKINDMNQGLLKEALELVNFDITLMNSMKQAPITANYDSRAANTEEHIISRAAFDTRQ